MFCKRPCFLSDHISPPCTEDRGKTWHHQTRMTSFCSPHTYTYTQDPPTTLSHSLCLLDRHNTGSSRGPCPLQDKRAPSARHTHTQPHKHSLLTHRARIDERGSSSRARHRVHEKARMTSFPFFHTHTDTHAHTPISTRSHTRYAFLTATTAGAAAGRAWPTGGLRV